MDEDVLAAVVADNEAKSLLRIEKLHDALSFADDLGRHSATAAATEASASATAAASESAAVISAESTTVPEAPIRTESAALLKAAAVAAVTFFEEPVALVSAATATVAFTPSVETHARQISLCPNRL
jgi:hypothetical protein